MSLDCLLCVCVCVWVKNVPYQIVRYLNMLSCYVLVLSFCDSCVIKEQHFTHGYVLFTM